MRNIALHCVAMETEERRGPAKGAVDPSSLNGKIPDSKRVNIIYILYY